MTLWIISRMTKIAFELRNQNSVKTEGRNPVVQSFQPFIPPTIQTPLDFQAPPCVLNPPRQMVATFSPFIVGDLLA